MDRKVRQYQVSEYEKGQRATDYPTWLSSSSHYTVKFEEVRFTPQQPNPLAPPPPPGSFPDDDMAEKHNSPSTTQITEIAGYHEA